MHWKLSYFAKNMDFYTLAIWVMEKEMATHPSVPAWRIPGTGEPGGLPSMGSHRVRHDWSDLAAATWLMVSSYIFSTVYLFSIIFQWQYHSIWYFLNDQRMYSSGSFKGKLEVQRNNSVIINIFELSVSKRKGRWLGCGLWI